MADEMPEIKLLMSSIPDAKTSGNSEIRVEQISGMSLLIVLIIDGKTAKMLLIAELTASKP